MREEFRNKGSLAVSQALVPFQLGASSGPTCHGCSETLDIEQPSAERPDRLLGVCPSCGAWEIIEIVEPGFDAWVTVIPETCWHDEPVAIGER